MRRHVRQQEMVPPNLKYPVMIGRLEALGRQVAVDEMMRIVLQVRRPLKLKNI